MLSRDYPYGFVSDIEEEISPKGLNEDTIRFLSQKKKEPEFLLQWRLQAFRHWQKMKEPTWANVTYPEIDYQNMSYYAAPKKKEKNAENSSEIFQMFDQLGVPLQKQNLSEKVAVDAIFDSVSVTTTFRETLLKQGIFFCSFSEATQEYPELIEQYLGTIVPFSDNFFAALNAAVFSDGSFCYIPKNVQCPMELSTYFRIHAANVGQFERTLIIAEEGSTVSYLEGCTAPARPQSQLHAAVVELIAKKNATIQYSTVQNWYPGDKKGKGGIYNFVTKRGICEGANAKISWTQIETGSAITWKYPSVVLKGDHSTGEFYSVAITNHCQQADTGTKMIHLGKNTKSRIISKGISSGKSTNTYRGLVKMAKTAINARSFSQCDSLLLSEECQTETLPSFDSQVPSATIEHEATTSKVSEDILFYCQQRGISHEEALSLIVHGYCKNILQHLPMEFAVEAKNLLSLKLEGTVG